MSSKLATTTLKRSGRTVSGCSKTSSLITSTGDESRLGASLHGTDYVTAPIAYLRLHGRNYKKWFTRRTGMIATIISIKPEELEPSSSRWSVWYRRSRKSPAVKRKRKFWLQPISTTRDKPH